MKRSIKDSEEVSKHLNALEDIAQDATQSGSTEFKALGKKIKNVLWILRKLFRELFIFIVNNL